MEPRSFIAFTGGLAAPRLASGLAPPVFDQRCNDKKTEDTHFSSLHSQQQGKLAIFYCALLHSLDKLCVSSWHSSHCTRTQRGMLAALVASHLKFSQAAGILQKQIQRYLMLIFCTQMVSSPMPNPLSPATVSLPSSCSFFICGRNS